MKKNNKHCVTCFKIICRRCGWIASEEEVAEIQNGEIIACPECGWKPGDTV
jgi:DNA-directed RNA polymerase subunit RPC12/RpoP